jgi:hypothetical protein
LDEKIKNASVTLFEEYLEKGEEQSAESALDIPRMARQSMSLNPYIHLKELKESWEKLTDFIKTRKLRLHEEFFTEI